MVGTAAWYASLLLGVAVSAAFGGVQGLRGVPLAVFAAVRALGAIAGIALAARIPGLRLSGIGLTAHRWPGDVAIDLAVGVLQPALQFALLIPNTGGAARSDVIASRALIGDGPPGLMAAIFAGWLAGGLAEEVFIRGHLITTVRHTLGNRPWSTVVAVLASSLYFGAAHTYQG